MPNWCQNVAYINHEDKDKIDYIVEELGKKEPQLFNSLCPRPAEHEEDWYGWNTSNWGTKWDASVYDHHTDADGQLYISFDTAWGPPIGFYEFLYQNGYDVEAFYNEEGMAFAGWFIDGEDNNYNYADMSADEIEDELPSRLDEMFNIAQYRRDWEDEQEDEDDEPDEPEYEMTEWFDVKTKPTHIGLYEIQYDKPNAWPFPSRLTWTGEKWLNDQGEERKDVGKWRGITQAEHESFLKLEELKKELDALIIEEN
jgi:hypothetical protein